METEARIIPIPPTLYFNSLTPHGDGNFSLAILMYSYKSGFNSLTPHGDGNCPASFAPGKADMVLIP